MVALEVVITVVSSSLLGLLFLLALVTIFYKLWWTPNRIQNLMGSQGIKGPSYKFIYGNTKEISTMKTEAMGRPMGLSHDVSSIIQPHVHLWSNKYGKKYLQWHGPQPQLIITESELIKEVLDNKKGAYPKEKATGFVRRLLGNGLVTIESGEKWTKMRKLANYAFHGDSLKNMAPAMVSSVDMMLERWKKYEGKEIELLEEFRLVTSEMISRTAFGSSYLEGEKIFGMLQKLFLLTARNTYKLNFSYLGKFFSSKDDIESEMLEQEIKNCVMEIIKKREDKVTNGEEDSFGSDFLGVLIKAHHAAEKNHRISVNDLVDECKTFYVAGQETTNTLLAWTVFLLAVHTDWQVEARKEVLDLFGQERLNPDGISKLKTMSMILNECMRLYPPVLGFERKVDKKVRLGDIMLPANLQIYISSLALHHDPQIWGQDVHEFKPERFSEGILRATNNNTAAFLPFGNGPRICVGTNFAFTEAKIALSMILQRYSFTISPAYVHSPIQLLTLHAQHGIQVILQPL
ncbi:cytochrome P450 CYP749A22-like [Humulus lupulus]|uniref:cytochrome P450 CYP749A22-like n=1 Tax=Humulus lupulus TaxID=3486 RepID=UPI002B40DE7A|nr:cytochrome P450 CYP749A22-like [Humulus lupulus]